MSDDRFPQELLQATSQERYKYFREWRVVHPKLMEARLALQQAIQFGDRQGVVHLFGCTGVGKTTLRRWMEKLLMEEAAKRMRANPDHMPVVSVVMPAPDQGPFSWRDVYVQTLYALGEPSLLVHSRSRPRTWQFVSQSKIELAPKTPRAELRLAMVGSLHHRDVGVLFYDDAQHLQMVTRAQRLEDQMENLKWLSDVSETTIILIGTYDVLNLIDLSGQLARRSTTIHFSRYHAGNSSEFQQFTNIIYAFQQQMPLKQEPNLLMHSHYLYERTLGCVGLLKGLLERVLATVLTKGEETAIDEKLLESCSDVRKLVAVAKEAVAGERRVYATDGLRAQLDSLVRSASQIPKTPKSSPKTVSAKQGNRTPGQRHAKRDPVGQEVQDGTA